MATDDTTRRVLDAALELFNERGVGTVSTRAIAKRAGLSSGNLHYHFPTKEAVVRALLERRRLLTDPIWNFPDSGPSLQALEVMLRQDLRLAWAYRFLQRELVTFTLGDPTFQSDYARIYRQRIDQLRVLLRRLVGLGLLALTADQLEEALTIGWIVSQNVLVHFEAIAADITDDRFAEGARLIMHTLDPAPAGSARRVTTAGRG